MADIINSVDRSHRYVHIRSLYIYIYIYIYRYISLSVYRSIFLYLFWLADIFASVERPDNKSLHLADLILIKLSNLLLVSPTMRCGRLPSRSDVNYYSKSYLLQSMSMYNIYIYRYYKSWYACTQSDEAPRTD